MIFKDGSLCAGEVFGSPQVQRLMLEEEGVGFLPDGRVDMENYRWEGPAEEGSQGFFQEK